MLGEQEESKSADSALVHIRGDGRKWLGRSPGLERQLRKGRLQGNSGRCKGAEAGGAGVQFGSEVRLAGSECKLL